MMRENICHRWAVGQFVVADELSSPERSRLMKVGSKCREIAVLELG